MSAIREEEKFLICRSDGRMLALALPDVLETMRPMSIVPLVGAPHFVLGLSIIRGTATPVIDAGQLLGHNASDPPAEDRGARRFVTLNTGARPVAIQVDVVSGLQSFSAAQLDAFPALIQLSGTPGVVALSVLDEKLLLVLQAARLVPAAVWECIDRSNPS
jgi:purine-binding chemotaxis protein CheW